MYIYMDTYISEHVHRELQWLSLHSPTNFSPLFWCAFPEPPCAWVSRNLCWLYYCCSCCRGSFLAGYECGRRSTFFSAAVFFAGYFNANSDDIPIPVPITNTHKWRQNKIGKKCVLHSRRGNIENFYVSLRVLLYFLLSGFPLLFLRFSFCCFGIANENEKIAFSPHMDVCEKHEIKTKHGHMAGPVGWWVCGWDVWMHGRMGHMNSAQPGATAPTAATLPPCRCICICEMVWSIWREKGLGFRYT